MKAAFAPYRLIFKFKAGTSRGILTYKDTYFIKVWDEAEPEKFGIGECALFRGLSAEDTPDYETALENVCRCVSNDTQVDLSRYSSICFGLETALYDFANGCRHEYYKSPFLEGESSLPINGLVWMGTKDEMIRRIDEKLDLGFTVIKIKIGAINFEEETDVIRHIRSRYSSSDVQIRLDANGGFSTDNALERIKILSDFDIHSLEQPIKAGNWEAMAALCEKSPIPIALDEELIGISDYMTMNELLKNIHPGYIILKPSLMGGIMRAEDWLKMAAQYDIGGWITSALESNVGLTALSQWVATLQPLIPQGLGTGNLFENNFVCPLELVGERLRYNPDKKLIIPDLEWKMC